MKLNINIENLILSKDIYQTNDIIRVTVTTLPEEHSYTFNIESKYIDDAYQSFTVETSELTKKIIIIFRKKNNSKKDLIIASTILRSEQFPKRLDDKSNNKIQNILIYEPFPKDFNNQNSILENRKILGNVDICFTIIPESNCENTDNTHKNISKYHPKLKVTKENVVITPE